MTVNTLGTDSGLVDDSFGQGASRASRTVAELLWPFFSGCVALFSISALLYYHFNQAEIEPRSALQHAVTFVYRSIGLAPAVLFFLLVAVWSTIWFVTGTLQRPAARLGRLLMMAVMLGVFLNLGDGGVVQAVHKGAVGGWLAERMVAAVGYVPSLILVWTTTFAALLLATDFFFSESFERMRLATRATESGVETAVTDHLRGLSGFPATGAALRGVAGASVAGGAATARAIVRPAAPAAPSAAGLDAADDDAVDHDVADLEAEAVRAAAAAADELAAAATGDASLPEADARQDAGDAGDLDRDEQADDDADEPRRMTYQERRAARDERRRRVALAELEQAAEAAAAAEQDGSDDESVGAGELDALLGEDEQVAVDDEVEAAADGRDDLAAAVEDEDGDDAFQDEADDAEADEDAADEDADEEDFEDELADEVAGELVDEDDAEEAEELADEHAELADEDLADEDLDDEEVDDEGLEDEEVDADEDLADEDLDEEDLDDEDLADDDLDDEEAGAEAAADARAEMDAASAVEDPEETSDAGESEPTVSIPRPEHPPVNPIPTPPAVPAAGWRQQRLFGAGADEDLVQEEIEVVVGARRATAALLQRKLRIDYELATELLAELAARGVVAFEGDASQGRVIGP